jgi:hypothetical protein
MHACLGNLFHTFGRDWEDKSLQHSVEKQAEKGDNIPCTDHQTGLKPFGPSLIKLVSAFISQDHPLNSCHVLARLASHRCQGREQKQARRTGARHPPSSGHLGAMSSAESGRATLQ